MKITATTIITVKDIEEINFSDEQEPETIKLKVRLPDERVYDVTMGNIGKKSERQLKQMAANQLRGQRVTGVPEDAQELVIVSMKL